MEIQIFNKSLEKFKTKLLKDKEIQQTYNELEAEFELVKSVIKIKKGIKICG